LKIVSLSQLVEMAANVPDPITPAHAVAGRNPVLRVQAGEWGHVIRDSADPAAGSPAYDNSFVEFELVCAIDTGTGPTPRWIFRGLVAI
jgi:hypothetical protein